MESQRFHWTLIELSKQITSDVLDNLKYMCQDVVVPTRMEKVKTPLDLFQALEECGKLSINNVQYLVDLLEAEGKAELVEVLVPHGSINSISEESCSSHTGTEQQSVYGLGYHYPSKLYE